MRTTVVGALICLIQCSCKTCGSDEQQVRPELPAPEALSKLDSGSPGSRVVAIEGAVDYTCALNSRGDVYCWGNLDAYPCEGSACKIDWSREGPEKIRGLPPAKQIAVGVLSAAAVTRDGEVYVWGVNVAPHYEEGEPLDPALDVRPSEHTEIRERDRGPQARTTEVALDTRLRTTGSMTYDGNILCLNETDGQSSCGSLSSTRELRWPPDVPRLGAAAEVHAPIMGASTDGRNVCIAFANGVMQCGEDPPLQASPLVRVAQDGSSWAATTKGQKVLFWINAKDEFLTYEPSETIVDLDVAFYEVCLLSKRGSVQCGVPSEGQPFTAYRIEDIEDAVDLVRGQNHVCWLDSAGTVHCKGNNGHGECGVVTNQTKISEPVQVPIPREP